MERCLVETEDSGFLVGEITRNNGLGSAELTAPMNAQ